MSIHKVVLKGTGKISLHERFTQLKFEQKPVPQQAAPPPSRSYGQSQSALRGYGGAKPRSRTPDQPRYSAARRRSESPPVSRFNSRAPAQRLQQQQQQLRNQSSMYSRKSSSSTMLAANRIKKKSVYLRLGVRPGQRFAPKIPVWEEPYTPPRQSYGMSRSASMNSLSRWNSQGSLNSYSSFPRYQQNRRRFNGGGGYRGDFRGGRRRNFAYGRGGGRRRFGGNRFGGGRGRFRGGRGRGRGNPPPPTREQLDSELDGYMAGARNLLDQELDTYMADKQ